MAGGGHFLSVVSVLFGAFSGILAVSIYPKVPGAPVGHAVPMERAEEMGGCEDHVYNGMDCTHPDIYPGICEKTYGKKLCCKTCQAPPTEKPVARKRADHPDDCVDHVYNGLNCTHPDIYPGICKDVFGKRLCCLSCRPHTDAPTTVATTTKAQTTTVAQTTTTHKTTAQHVTHAAATTTHPPATTTKATTAAHTATHHHTTEAPTTHTTKSTTPATTTTAKATTHPTTTTATTTHPTTARATTHPTTTHATTTTTKETTTTTRTTTPAHTTHPHTTPAHTTPAHTTAAPTHAHNAATTAPTTTLKPTTTTTHQTTTTHHTTHPITTAAHQHPPATPPPTTTTTAQAHTNVPYRFGCANHIMSDSLTCEFLPNICSTEVGQTICQRFCNRSCDNLPDDTKYRTAPTDPCSDLVGPDLTCAQLPFICGTGYGPLLCAGHCNTCSTTPPPPTTTIQTTTVCEDYVGGHGMTCESALLAGFCTKDTIYSQVLCPKTCGYCGATSAPTQTSFKPWWCPVSNNQSSSTCQDEADFEVCNHIPYCDDDYAKIVCRKTCGFCKTCQDLVDPQYTCNDLRQLAGKTQRGFCIDPLARSVCLDYCGCC